MISAFVGCVMISTLIDVLTIYWEVHFQCKASGWIVFHLRQKDLDIHICIVHHRRTDPEYKDNTRQ